MNFRVGQKVVLVEGFTQPRPGEALPEVGGIYTVRDRVFYDDILTLRLDEIRNPEMDYGPGYGIVECSFHAENFRPAVQPSIDVFNAMLTKTPEQNLSAARRLKRQKADA
jgi:hypothetical protein